MNVERAVFSHCREPPPNLISDLDDPLICALIEAREGQFAAGFVHLLRDAAAQVVKPTVELAHLRLIINSLQRRSRNSTIENCSTFENIRDLLAQDLSRTYRPDQRSHRKCDKRTLDRINHAQPCHMPGFRSPAKDKDDRCSETSRRESWMQRREIGEEAGQHKQNDAGADRSFAEYRDQ